MQTPPPHPSPMRTPRSLFALLLLAAPLLQAQQVFPLLPGDTAAQATQKDVSDNKPIAGRPIIRLTDITHPTLTYYPAPAARNTGAAAIVLPGGGYQVLAADLEGTEVCTWLNTLGVNCAVVKYRVPQTKRYPDSLDDLADAQAAMRLMRTHATDWHLDPHRVGVIGFSAGAHLAAVLSAHAEAGASTPQRDAHPDFAMIIYPGYFTAGDTMDRFNPAMGSIAAAPPTFIVQAEDDPVHVENAVLYFLALKQARIPAELHIYAEGGHGYGLRPTAKPITHWSDLAATWLQTIHVLPQ